MRLSIRSDSEERTGAIGAAIGHVLRPGDVVALHGELGAGKTRLVRGIAEGLGAAPGLVSSPTFVIMQEYPCGGGGVGTLVHMDAYRLRGADELESVGWDRLARDLEERRGVALVVEWAERIDAALGHGASRLDVRLEHDGEGRRLRIEGDGGWGEREGWARVARFAVATTPCPVTGRPVPLDSASYPFIDERARLADLGKWLSGSYRITRPPEPGDGEEAGEGGSEE